MENNPILVSALIPTRCRPDRLRKTIQSLRDTAYNPDAIEYCLRIDDDDQQTIESLHGLNKDFNVRSVIGPRHTGYFSMGQFVTEIADISTGTWNFLIDDDCWLEGKGWDTQLKAVPTTGWVSQAEFYHLGHSKYGSGSCGPVGMFVPNQCWKQFGYDQCQGPVDLFWQNVLIKENHWQTRLLRDIIYRHDRDHESILKQHRK